MNVIELRLDVEDHLHELLIAELDELGGEGYVQEEHLLKAYVPVDNWGESEKSKLIGCLHKFKAATTSWKEQLIEEQDWNEPWEKSITPIRVGEFYIRPSWAPPLQEKSAAVVEIIIDPKMSFGTGHHETTRLVLRELPSFVKKGDVILDAGVGTSILSIAAIKKGASSVIGFDIDEWAINNGLENAARNSVSDKLILRKGSIDVITERTFDVVFANINLNVLLKSSRWFASKLRPNGHLLLSGILRSDDGVIKQAFEAAGFYTIRNSYEGEWQCSVMQKKEQYE